MTQGITKDISQEYVDAISIYEKEISTKIKAPERAYINLAFLHWIITADFGFYSYHNIPEELREISANAYFPVLEKALEVYPKSIEIKFWKKYFLHRDLDEEFTIEECLSIIKAPNGDPSLVPYFYLHMIGAGGGYTTKIQALLHQCIQEPTAKHEYVRSIVEE